jgi:hypothetical protein
MPRSSRALTTPHSKAPSAPPPCRINTVSTAARFRGKRMSANFVFAGLRSICPDAWSPAARSQSTSDFMATASRTRPTPPRQRRARAAGQQGPRPVPASGWERVDARGLAATQDGVAHIDGALVDRRRKAPEQPGSQQAAAEPARAAGDGAPGDCARRRHLRLAQGGLVEPAAAAQGRVRQAGRRSAAAAPPYAANRGGRADRFPEVAALSSPAGPPPRVEDTLRIAQVARAALMSKFKSDGRGGRRSRSPAATTADRCVTIRSTRTPSTCRRMPAADAAPPARGMVKQRTTSNRASPQRRPFKKVRGLPP